jgi:uncharacterized protein YbjT (DUF2867 family)
MKTAILAYLIGQRVEFVLDAWPETFITVQGAEKLNHTLWDTGTEIEIEFHDTHVVADIRSVTIAGHRLPQTLPIQTRPRVGII